MGRLRESIDEPREWFQSLFYWICFSNLKNPSVIIHEFYHHIRIDLDQKHRGNERNAREFAQDFIETYKR